MLRMNRNYVTGKKSSGSNVVVETANGSSGPQKTIKSGNIGTINSSGIHRAREIASETKETANAYMIPSGTGASSGIAMQGVVSPQMVEPLLDGFIPQDPILHRRMFREIYYNDPVSGSALDMLSTFPFSDFSLVGVNDEKRMVKFMECVDALRVKHLLPSLSLDYLIHGAFIGTLNWDSNKKNFNALLPQNIDFCSIQSSGLYDVDPVVKVKLPDQLLKMLNAPKNEQMKENLRRIPEDVLEAFKKNKEYVIDPDQLIYISRSTMVGDYMGTSMLQRVLPIWAIEKAYIRGTLDQAWKRQRPILVASAGDAEWEPTPEDMNALADMIIQADIDPTGSAIITRNGVNFNEIRRGDDLWSWDRIWEWSRSVKLMAMGINESFVGSDATVGNMEGTINVMVTFFRQYRNKIEREVFYDKTFPLIAVANNYLKANPVALGADGSKFAEDWDRSRIRRFKDENGDIQLSAECAGVTGIDMHNKQFHRYSYPKINWHNALEGTNDEKTMEMLKLMEEKGIPVPLRVWASAANQTLENLAEQKDSDLKQRKWFADWFKAMKAAGSPVPEFVANSDSGNSGGDGDGFSFASAIENGSTLLAPPSEHGSIARVGVLERDFGDLGGIKRRTHKGTMGILSLKGHKEQSEEANKKIVEASRNIRDREKAVAEKNKPEPVKKYYYKR